MMSSGDERSGEEDDERRRGMEVFGGGGGGGDQNGGGSVFICIVIEATAFELCMNVYVCVLLAVEVFLGLRKLWL